MSLQSTSSDCVIERIYLGDLEATISEVPSHRDEGHPWTFEWVLEIRRFEDQTLLEPHQYTISNLEVIEKLVSWGQAIIRSYEEDLT